MADVDETTAVLAKAKPTTFEDLPGELRNRIYDESGSLQYYEGNERYETSFCGDYTPEKHTHVHGCTDGAVCRYAEWPTLHEELSKAMILVNRNTPKIDNFYPGRSRIPGPCEDLRYPSAHHRRRRVQCDDATVAQPPLTRVSQRIRADTLPMFYGNHTFVFALLGHDVHLATAKIIHYLDTIGPHNAQLLTSVMIVHSKNKHVHFINRTLVPEMKRHGLNGELLQVRCVKIGYPFNQTDNDALEFARRGMSDADDLFRSPGS